MATNPMQRRARNSFLLGALVMTLLLGAVIGFLFFIMMNLRKENSKLQASEVYVLTADVQSGAEIDATNLTTVRVSGSAAPANAISPANLGEKNIAKINIKAKTILTGDMIYIDETSSGSDVRKQEYNTVILPMDLITGDFVDIRLLLPSGQDFIVVSKKKVEIPQIAGVDATDTISVELSEDEILSMSNAIVEAFMINGSKIYAAKYTDAGNQEAAQPTYPVNSDVRKLMNNDPNIVEKAKAGLVARLNNEDSKKIREENINAQISAQEDATTNEQTKMEESLTKSQTSREEYLQSLAGGTLEN